MWERRRATGSYALPPWLRVRRLPEAVPIALGVFLIVSALAKVVATSMCHSPHEAANGIMTMVEIPCGLMLFHPRLGRRVAALFWAPMMPCAAVYLAYMEDLGFDARSCGCFGPVELDFTAHLAVLAILCAVATAVFLREETRVQDRHDERDLRRLVRPFE